MTTCNKRKPVDKGLFRRRGRSCKLWIVATAMLAGLFSSVYAPAAEENVEQMTKNGELAYSRGDVVDAMRWYRKAARQGYPPAQTRLARILDASEQNKEAFKWYQQAANQNFPEAEYELGILYSIGEGVSQDLTEALRWIRRAAGHEYVEAMRFLALTYEKGTMGQQRDDQKAVSWLERGMALGDAASITRLATAYRKGELGLAPDPAKAAELEAKLPQPEMIKKVDEKKK